MSELVKRILKVQENAAPVLKDGSVGGKYKFASYNAVLAAVRSLCLEQGILLAPTFSEYTEEGNRCSMKCTLRLMYKDESIDYCSFGQGVDNQDKGAGKAQTYALKNALLQAFMLTRADEDDPDFHQGPEANHRSTPTARPRTNTRRGPAATPSKERLNYLRDLLISEYGDKESIQKELKKKFNIERTDALTEPQVEKWIGELE